MKQPITAFIGLFEEKLKRLKDDLKKVIDKLNINEKVDIETVNPSKRNRELNYYYEFLNTRCLDIDLLCHT